LLGSWLRRRLNPRDYLNLLFGGLPTATNQNVANLTPKAFAKFQAGAADAPRPARAAA
jgi:hypothetical protein